MSSLFDDEILSVVLRFSNPNKALMEEADKTAAHLSMSLDNVVRRAVSAGRAINEIADDIRGVEGTLKRLEEKAGGQGISSQALKTTQAVLARYTTFRLDRMSEVQGNKLGETSGVASLRKELQKNNELIQRAITSGKVFDKATKGSDVGKGLYLGSRTIGVNQAGEKVVEVAASLFSFSKKTGEILNKAEQVYRDLHDLSRDVSRQQSAQGKHPLSSLAANADFVVAHGAGYTKRIVEQIVPSLAKTWLDSRRDVPWRTLGSESLNQKDLMRMFGIAASSSRSATGSVDSGLQLLSSRSAFGGPTFLKMMLDAKGPQNASQQMLSVVKNLAEEIHSDLKQRLSDQGRYLMPRPQARTRAIEGDQVTRYVVESIEGGITARSRKPSSSNEFGMKTGSGVAADMTPGTLGPSAISIDRRSGITGEFLRNIAVMSGPRSSGEFLKLYSGQHAHQQEIQSYAGSVGRRSKDDTRLGNELMLSVMKGLNTQLSNRRLGMPTSIFGVNYGVDSTEYDQRTAMMLSQPWAKPPAGKTLSNDRVESFVAEYHKGSASDVIGQAAKYANYVGPKHSRYQDLLNIMYSGQGENLKKKRASRSPQGRLASLDRFTSRNLAGNGEARPSLVDETLNELPIASNSLREAINRLRNDETGSVNIGGLFDIFKKHRSTTSSAPPPIGSYEDRARGPLPDPTDLSGSKRRDTLDAKLRRLEETIELTTKSFERFKNVTAQQLRDQAAEKFFSRNLDINKVYEGSRASLEYRKDRLDARNAKVATAAAKSSIGVEDSLNAKSRALGMTELRAELRYESAVNRQNRGLDALRASPGYKKKKAFDRSTAEDEYISATQGSIDSAQLRLMEARYRSQAAKLTDPAAIEALRSKTAQAFSATRYGNEGSLTSEGRQYTSRVSDLLADRTPGQQAKAKIKDIAQAQQAAEAELEKQRSVINERMGFNESNNNNKRAANEARFASTLNKINDDIASKAEQSGKKRTQAEQKAHEAKVAFLKQEDIIAGRGKGGGGGSGGEGGGGKGVGDFASRGGMDFGIGLASVAAYSLALKELIQDSTIYAARTQTMLLVTDQMAKVNNLNTDQVQGQVQAVQRLNITTQEANASVQKMMFAQLDVAKATNLARVAQDAAILANVNSSEALDRIILGIVTGQTRLLHNMGLQVSLLQTVREIRLEKRSKGDNSDPTELEKRQAMLNKVLLEGSKIMGTYERSMLTAGKQFNSLQREIQEAQNAIGKEFLPEFGRFVSLSTKGLHYIQENGDATAKFASGMLSLGSAASAIGSLSFIRWMMSTPAIPWWAKGIGAVVGVATYKAMNQDDAGALSTTADEQQESLAKQVARLRKERKELLANKEDSPEWKNTWERNTESLRALGDAQVGIQEELTKQLAEQYDKRLADLDKFSENISGRKGWLSQIGTVTSLFLNPSFDSGSGTGDTIFGARNVPSNAKMGISTKDVVAAQRAAKAKRENPTLLSPSLQDASVMRASGIVAEFYNASKEIEKFTQENDPFTGNATKRAMKAGDSPREKATVDHEMDVAKTRKFYSLLQSTKTRAEQGDPMALADWDKVLTSLSGVTKDKSVAKQKIEEALKDQQAVIDHQDQNFKIRVDKIDRATRASITQSQEAIPLATAQSGVFQGNFESEKKGIQEAFRIRKEYAGKIRALTGDIDQYNIKISQNEVDRTIALMKLDEDREKARRARLEEGVQESAAYSASRLIQEPGDPRRAINQGHDLQMTATSVITDEQKRIDAQIKLRRQRRDALDKVNDNEEKLTAQGDVSSFDARQELAAQVDRTISSRGLTNNQRSLAEIERTRLGSIASAENKFKVMQPVTASTDQFAVAQEFGQSTEKANFSAAAAKVKELDAQVEAARNNLADSFKTQFQKIERINELRATGSAEEASAAYNTHKARLEYIEKEYAARGKTVDSEKEKRKEIQEAEFDHLQKLLEIRKKEVEGVRNAAGSVFDAMLSHGGGGLSELITSQAKVTGRQIFQNTAVEYFGGIRSRMGNVIPGQEKKDAQGNVKPTFLGRMLGGTIFSPSHTEDINKLMTQVTKENTSVEQELTAAIKSLDEAVRAAQGISSGVPGATTGSPGAIGSIKDGGLSGFDFATVGGAFVPGLNSSSGKSKDVAGDFDKSLKTNPSQVKALRQYYQSIMKDKEHRYYQKTKEMFDANPEFQQMMLGQEADEKQVSTVPITLGKKSKKTEDTLTKYQKLIIKKVRDEAAKQGIDPDLAQAVARKESGYGSNVVGANDDVGIMQLRPDAAHDMGVKNRWDEDQNIKGGVKLLKTHLDRFGSPELALSAYNSGAGNVQKKLDKDQDPVTPYAKSVMAFKEQISSPAYTSPISQEKAPYSSNIVNDSEEDFGRLTSSFSDISESSDQLDDALVENTAAINKLSEVIKIGPGTGSQFSATATGQSGLSQGMSSITKAADLARMTEIITGRGGAANPLISRTLATAGAVTGLAATVTKLIGGGSSPTTPVTKLVSGGSSPTTSITSAPTPNWNGVAVGNTGQVFKNGKIVTPGPGRFDSFMGGMGGAVSGQYNMFDVFSGKSSVRTPQGATGMTGAQRAGAGVGAALQIAGGVMTAKEGFSKGGAKGITQGIGGILTAAATIPGPQQPFVAAGAMIAGFVSSMLGDKTEKRQKDITEFMNKNKYIEPITINREMSAKGNLLSYNKYGKVRDTGDSAFPIDIQQTTGQYPEKRWNDWSSNYGTPYEYLPGRVLDTPPTKTGGDTVYNVTMPISAIDTKDFLARSKDITAAVQKEMKLGSDISISMQSAVFGAF